MAYFLFPFFEPFFFFAIVVFNWLIMFPTFDNYFANTENKTLFPFRKVFCRTSCRDIFRDEKAPRQEHRIYCISIAYHH